MVNDDEEEVQLIRTCKGKDEKNGLQLGEQVSLAAVGQQATHQRRLVEMSNLRQRVHATLPDGWVTSFDTSRSFATKKETAGVCGALNETMTNAAKKKKAALHLQMNPMQKCSMQITLI